ncbi:glycosyltransferase family 4 protein [Bacillus thuringiensis]|uniref:glycosyltransferase family 4 protein n=1 Tax=Bacillus thuringiensis TaxID=1428 RepID=UPI000BEBF4CC|nr:glycosyltransferase family 4 protein [Bacillus thuringiensis]HEB2433781.1 glycosyltransferase family 4 protein [Bacillus cereus]MED3309468.1 glycosyltransferase family 4 protein [Bacillus thuringiensis]PEB76741.1 hypothetical protein COM89_04285 [Bacillus thuringiensis]PFM95971.1 hypothetical protein COJ51_21185 [Bacillus thuringiensis]PFU58541.1 hypothetical protein COK85_17745 [Bacillus thuringiensis]
MRILLISSLPPPEGGISTWTKIYNEHCKKSGHFVDIINTALTGRRAKKINSKRNLLDEIFRMKNIFVALFRYLKMNKADIVHINSSCGSLGIIRDYLVINLIRKKKIPVILHLHCNAADQLKSKLAIHFFNKAVKLASEVLVLNKDTKEYVKETCCVESQVVPNFIQENWILKNKKEINKEVKKIIFIGHVQPAKGVEDIFEISKMYPDIQFILAGPVKSNNDGLIVSKNVKLLGAIEQKDVQALLDSADVFLFPTRSEGFSMALTEAMARGIPIITTRVGANSDMIEECGGVVVSVGDVHGMVRAIEKLKNIEIRTKMSNWNIHKVRENYTVEKVMVKLFSIYDEIL